MFRPGRKQSMVKTAGRSMSGIVRDSVWHQICARSKECHDTCTTSIRRFSGPPGRRVPHRDGPCPRCDHSGRRGSGQRIRGHRSGDRRSRRILGHVDRHLPGGRGVLKRDDRVDDPVELVPSPGDRRHGPGIRRRLQHRHPRRYARHGHRTADRRVGRHPRHRRHHHDRLREHGRLRGRTGASADERRGGRSLRGRFRPRGDRPRRHLVIADARCRRGGRRPSRVPHAGADLRRRGRERGAHRRRRRSVRQRSDGGCGSGDRSRFHVPELYLLGVSRRGMEPDRVGHDGRGRGFRLVLLP